MKAKIFTSALVLMVSAGILAGCSQLVGRSDAQIATEVQQKLLVDPAISTKQIQVQADKGVIDAYLGVSH